MTRIVVASLSLLSAVFAWLAAPTYERLVSNREQATLTRVALVADDLARDVERAVDVGIEPAQLRGLGEMFAAQVKGRSELVGVELWGADGKTLIAYPQTVTEAEVQDTRQVVTVRGQTRATVRVLFQSDAKRVALTQVLTVGVGILLLGALPALVLFYRALRRGPALRDAAFTAQLTALSRGDYTQLLALPHTVDHDQRMLWLARHIRIVHEKHARLQRLCLSLLATEPSPSRREALYQLRESAASGNTFAPTLAHSTVDDMSARRGWSLLLGTAAFVLLGLPHSATSWSGSVFFLMIALGSLSALAIFHSSIRDFGCWLFAISLGAVAAFARDAGWLPVVLSGLSLGLLSAVVLDRDTSPYWFSGCAVGSAIVQLTPAGLIGWTWVLALALLAAAFLSRAPEDAQPPVLPRAGAALAVLVGLALGLVLAPNRAEPIDSASLLRLAALAGLATTVWLAPGKRHWAICATPIVAFTLAYALFGAPGYVVVMLIAGLGVGMFVREAVPGSSHGFLLACGASVGCLAALMLPLAASIAALCVLPIAAAALRWRAPD